MDGSQVQVGIISDTHGLLREEAMAALVGSDVILHAGDVGDPAILQRLVSLAPVFVVRGNVDGGPWAQALPEYELVEVRGVTFYMRHILDELDLDPVAAGVDVVVYGHSHEPAAEQRDGVLYLNPGSAGPQRFDLPVTVARLTLRDGEMEAKIVEVA